MGGLCVQTASFVAIREQDAVHTIFLFGLPFHTTGQSTLLEIFITP